MRTEVRNRRSGTAFGGGYGMEILLWAIVVVYGVVSSVVCEYTPTLPVSPALVVVWNIPGLGGENTMKIFTIKHSLISEGALVEEFKLASGITIPAVLVGEEGRGRELGVLPIKGAQPGDVVTDVVVSSTRSGRPCLIAQAASAGDDDSCVVIMRTEYGFRGSCGHTGDFSGVVPTGKRWSPWRALYEEFPGQILVRGIVADGLAGRMASGEQVAAVVRAGQVFRAWRSGRLYGQPDEYFYTFSSGNILVAAWQDRELLDGDHPLALSSSQIAAMEEARRIEEEAAKDWAYANTT